MILTLWPSFPQTKRKQLITETENTEKQDGEPRDKHERSQLGLQFAELSTLPYWSVCVSVCECFRGGRVAAEPTGALWVVPSQVFSLCLDTSSAALPSVSLAVAHLILLFLHATFSSPVLYLHPCWRCIMCVAALLMMADRIAVRTLIMWWPPAWRLWDHASVFI